MKNDDRNTASDRVPTIPACWSPQERNRWASSWVAAQAKLQRLEAERIAAMTAQQEAEAAR